MQNSQTQKNAKGDRSPILLEHWNISLFFLFSLYIYIYLFIIIQQLTEPNSL